MWILLALALALLAAYFIFQQKIEMLPPAPVKESVLPAEPVDLGGSQPAITREMTPEAGDEKRQGAAVASAEEKPILIEEVLPEIQVDLGTIEPPVTHEADTAAEEEKKSVAAMTPPGEERAAIIMVVPADIRTKLELYVVEQGDTLWDISGKMTGDPFNFLKVADENKIDNPDLIFPAQKIVIQKEPASAIEQETEHVP
ncbi:MAG: LysM peptidoglycan-binding domain-containing protein [Thermodesulfobacteriota bacterium]